MNTSELKLDIRKLEPDFIGDFSLLMDAYRMFYGRPSNIAQSTSYVRTLFEKDTVVFLMAVLNDTEVIGFCTLFQSYSSVRASPIYILNDLYVSESHRRYGCGAQLLRAAARQATSDGMAFLKLETAKDNDIAQKAYRQLGWKPSEFVPYAFEIGNADDTPHPQTVS
ncbi:MAG: GNAT family N-acetyltransferase [Candidatus Halichondribacter symbioticus]